MSNRLLKQQMYKKDLRIFPRQKKFLGEKKDLQFQNQLFIFLLYSECKHSIISVPHDSYFLRMLRNEARTWGNSAVWTDDGRMTGKTRSVTLTITN